MLAQNRQTLPTFSRNHSSGAAPRPWKKHRSLFPREAIEREVRHARGSRWIQVRKHGDCVARLRTDLQIAIHARGAAAVAKAPNSTNGFITEAVSVFFAAGGVHFACR